MLSELTILPSRRSALPAALSANIGTGMDCDSGRDHGCYIYLLDQASSSEEMR